MTASVAPAGRGTVVLGMHRSGTSAVTHLLQQLGGQVCAPADRLSGTEHGRRVSYWESRSTVLVNETLLGAFGGDWASPPELGPHWWTSPPAQQLAGLAGELFWSVHPADGWLCKDPRLCITLPFWRAWVMPDVRVVFVVRHPDEVAASLNRRDGLDRRHGWWLWQRYTRGAVEACRGVPAMVVSYDRLCQDPVGTGRALQAWAFPDRDDSQVGEARLRSAAARVHREKRDSRGRGGTGPGPGSPGLELYEALAALHAHFPSSDDAAAEARV